MATPEARSISPQGLELRLWDHAPGAELPVALFVHGYLDTGRSYDRVAQALEGRVRVLCLDWRGHGQSQWAPGGASYHLLDHVKDLAATIVHLSEEDTPMALLVAHSMGANIALMAAGAWPEIVPRLLLLDAFGPPAEDPEVQPHRIGNVLKAMQVVKPFRRFPDYGAAVSRIVATNHGLSREGADLMARHLVAEDPLAPGQWAFKLDPRLRGPTPVRYPEETWRAFCARLQGPVRLLRAEWGYLPESEVLKGRLAACKDASMRTLPGAHHHLHVEAPSEVAAEVLALLGL